MPINKSGFLNRKLDIFFLNQLFMLAYAFFFIFTFASPYTRAWSLYLLSACWLITALMIDMRWLNQSKWIIISLILYVSILLIDDLLLGRISEFLTFIKGRSFFFIFIIMGVFNAANFNKFNFSLVCKIIFLLLFISYVATFLGLLKYPSASRDLASSGLHEMNPYYQKIGIGGFSFIYHSFYLMVLILFLLKDHKKWYSKVFLIFCVVFIYITIYKSNYTTAFLLATAALILSLFFLNGQHSGIKVLILLLAGLVLLIFSVPCIQFVIKYLITDESSTIRIRLTELMDALVGDIEFNRISLIKQSFQAFQENPFFGELGKVKTIGGHSDFFDIFGSYGLIGAIIYNSIFFSAMCFQYKKLKSAKYKRCLLIIYVVFMALRIMNPILASQSIACIIFLICPIFLYTHDDMVTNRKNK